MTGVDYHETTVELSEMYLFNVTYDTSINLKLFPISPNSVSVYIQDFVLETPEQLMGTDDGLGNFIAESGFDLTGSSVNYTTGAGGIISAALPEPYQNYNVRLAYSIVSNDLILKGRYQIFDYDDVGSTIVTQYGV